ncbi:acyl-CoA-binding domain-containing protein 5A-like isoform X3 [Hippocampus comes]|uniref:acyl-CoA-binding domain-containing protein 5A-like isoform X2 n=1 Tax=Hippocampus comes TaxID=109280 RepID=UPI00094EEFAA|nr:PREDICTED: acyl-CoA-binding domain-containing protein 5A-like isoform X2 [Hippocampus comes]XP_019733366.1 PREDICTED: acyl-CoA-binding domain-containing protein 5A-like isoform X3 [Hippocampus comes]XP_019733368.1 PREDICTED: acyl-CoA-binding domain-containing protein 5A-like isoform X3 [Hippocampus comes]
MAQEDQHSLQAKFAAAVKVIWSLPKQGPFQLSDDMMLMFYSYYKQSTVGPCTFTRPTGFWASHEKNKWDAWSSLGNMSKEEAMKNYVENIQLILETMPVSNEVSDLVRQLGNFYLEEEEGGGEENEAECRPFTRPFAKQAEPVSPKKPAMEGYGDLWDDIQNFQEEESSMSFNGAEAVECEEDIGYLRKEEMGEVDNVDEEDGADGEGWGLEPRPHVPQDTTWRCCTRRSGSSVEPSMSSLTNGTHSSLDSEVEEEELAYAKQHSTCGPIYVDFNGHLLDHNDAVKKSNHLADSDNEEFCDSMDDPTMSKLLSTSQIQSGGSTSTLGKEHDLWFESSSALKAEDRSLRVNSCHEEPHKRVRESPSPKTACSYQLWLRTCDTASECTRHSAASWANVNEQMVKTLLKLQDDMSDALHRLHTLEGLTVAQSSSSLSRCADTPPVAQKFFTPSWWPFDHSPITMVMTALWPAIAFGLVQLYSRRKRR